MKKMLFLILLITYVFNSYAQQIVVELFYNIGGYQYSSLCVFDDGRKGKCNVLSCSGNCWFDADLSKEGDSFVITTSNPSDCGWLPGVCYLNSYSPFITFGGNRFLLNFSVVPVGEWNMKKAQYGFRVDSTSFGSDKPVTVNGAPCSHSGCHCRAYKGYRTPAGTYTVKCSNSDGWGHTCNHSPKEHGL